MSASSPPPQLSWRAQALGILFTIVITATVAALAGEAAVRYREAHRKDVPGSMPFVFYRHSRLGHALVHGASYYGWVHIDRQGFRGPDVAPEPTRGTTRIMVIGSSTTFDSYVSSDDRAWPARLGFYLTRAGHPVEVINAGVPGYNFLQDQVRLQSELVDFKPALIILYEGHNDLLQALRRAAAIPADSVARMSITPDEAAPITPWGYWLDRHSLLYSKVAQRWEAIRFNGLRRQTPASTKVTGTRAAGGEHSDTLVTHQIERSLAAFLAVAQSLGLRVVVPELVQVAGPDTAAPIAPAARSMWAANPFASPETIRRLYTEYNADLPGIASRFGATAIPTASFGLAGPSYYSAGDPIHFNDRGADQMAQHMASALVNAHLIPTLQ